MIDSAANNHRRFILGQSGRSQVFDGYAQNEWVSRGRYQQADWEDLVTLWRLYNLQLARVVEAMSDEDLQNRHSSGTLQFIVEDYVAHMRHHLTQIQSMFAT